MSSSTFQIPRHRKGIAAAAFLDDERLVVSVTGGNSVFVASLADGTELSQWKGHKSAGQAIAVSPCRQLVATGDCNGVVRLWTSRGDSLYQFGEPGWFQRCAGPLLFSSDSRRLIIRRESDLCSWGDTLWQLDTSSFEEQCLLLWEQIGVQDLRFSANGQQLFAATEWGGISRWTLSGRIRQAKWIRIELPLQETQLCPKRNSQPTLVFRNPPKPNDQFAVHPRFIDCAASLALVGPEETAFAWGKLIVVYRLNGQKRKQVGYFEATSARLTKLLESNQQDHIWSLDDQGRVTLWNMNTQSAEQQYETGLKGAKILLTSPDESMLVVAAGRKVCSITR